ncbi:MAG: ABC transporter ATP-binding protein [Clostridia bacterium]|nr:ABC transporter ATP-binding protein [Clostridia bacterium]
MFKVNNIYKKDEEKDLLNNISFRVKDNESLGIIGPHKCGKTILMNILSGVIRPSSGNVELEYQNIFNPLSFNSKKDIGYAPQDLIYYPNLTVYEFLDYIAVLKDIIDKKERLLEVERILDLFEIQSLRNKLMKNLSRSLKQKINLAQAFLGNPKVLLFDEPTLGLNPVDANYTRDFLKRESKDHIFIVASHILPEVSSICKDLIVMDEGKIIVNDLAKNLSKDFCQRNILSVDTCGDIDDVKGIFDIYEEVLLIDYIKKDDNNFTIRMELKKDTDIRKDVFKELSSLRMPINNMTLEPLTLEDLYGRLETFGEIPEAKIKSEKSKVVDIKTKRLKSQEDK